MSAAADAVWARYAQWVAPDVRHVYVAPGDLDDLIARAREHQRQGSVYVAADLGAPSPVRYFRLCSVMPYSAAS